MSAKLRSPEYLVALVCVAQVFVQIGASFWPALLPGMIALWQLSNSEAGWITAIFFGAYMVSVPVLVTLTDRFDTRTIYLIGVALTVSGHLLFSTIADGFWSALFARALTGVGWAGTYMTGLKLLADQVEGKLMSRATAGHAASIGISGALSFACADLIANLAGWRAAFLAAAASAALAWLLVALAFPRHSRAKAPEPSRHALFDFRPVFRNRSAMAYALTYCIHTFEFHAVRGWGVVFLAFVASATGGSEFFLSPPLALTALGLIATATSVMGNEAAIRFGRRRLIAFALDRIGDMRRAPRYLRACVLSVLGCSAALVWRFHFARFRIADRRIRRQRRPATARGDPRGSFDARLRGRLPGAAGRGLDTRSGRRKIIRLVGSCLSDGRFVHADGPDPVFSHAAAGADR